MVEVNSKFSVVIFLGFLSWFVFITLNKLQPKIHTSVASHKEYKSVTSTYYIQTGSGIGMISMHVHLIPPFFEGVEKQNRMIFCEMY